MKGSSGYGMSRHRKARRGSLASKRGERSYRLMPPVLELEAAILELARQQPIPEGRRKRRKRAKRPVEPATAPLMREALEELAEPGE